MPEFRIALAALAALTVVTTTACGSDPESTAEPTVVLVHGSFSDRSGWDRVADLLRDKGFPVIQPDNPLRGPGADAAAVTADIANVTGPVVLVGHSYGGAVISNIRRPDIAALVFVAGFAPAKDETVQALSDPATYPGSRIGPALRIQPTGQGAEVTLAPEHYRDVFAHDVSAEVAAELAARQRPTAAAAQAEPCGDPLWASVPSWYLVATQDRILPPASQRFQADRAKARVREVESSHAAPMSHPEDVVAVIAAAAR
ncbi:alpha/beta fold hydrolase [Nocardia caishijiensis]|uniref:Pimeloyl-ACP methyl ester carboxylesterase n=1 Tax=Nocardia caishijiensis TaxID=184756 RepID=A0ABQ6YNI7_9NOCA|nr:alpha/beta hydrolase [Nocardia caishijiensis]KAF0847350.1 pimeloyl-ACP methyl ester carboxylesterase [Nocardia caishijiensis]